MAREVLPHAREYATREYWEVRFKKETAHDWLCSFSQVRDLLQPYLGSPATSRILILGNGTSLLPLELVSAGFSCVVATDYVLDVVETMRARHAGTPIVWACADALALTPNLGTFDVVIDKGVTDAIVSAEGDSWSPPPEALAASHAVCRGVAALLEKGGRFVQISFSQPHFRAVHLLQHVSRGAPSSVPPPPPPLPSLLLAVAEDDGEFEPDLNPGASRPALQSVAWSLWATFEVLKVDAGLGYFCYVCVK